MIDATSLARKITGIENYTKNLVENILLQTKPDDKVYLLFRKEVPKYMRNREGFTSLVSPFQSQVLCEQIWIPWIKLRYKPDVIHFPAFPPPLLVKSNVVFTVHDATMWKYKETLSFKNKLYMRPLTNRGIKISKKILTVSESSRGDLVEVFPFVINKIKNTGISITENIEPVKDSILLNAVVNKYDLPKKFLLTVGSLEPRKNLIFLVKAFIKFKKNFPNDMKLVITGRNAWGSQEIKKLIKGYEGDIILTGYVSDEELRGLYSLAHYFVFPSIYEGFGLPVLEAMACGTPVILSHTSSLPEVAGEAALYFNPHSEKSLVETLKCALEEENLRVQLKEKGAKRRKVFSWKKIASSIYKEYSNI